MTAQRSLQATVHLKEYRQMLMTAYKRLSKLKAEGKTAKEAIAAAPLPILKRTGEMACSKGIGGLKLFIQGSDVFL